MDVLCQANQWAHISRPATPQGHFLTLWHPSERFIHCCIESQGCRYSREMGACIMCDYGVGRNLTPRELGQALEEEVRPFEGKLDTLLLGSYGSVLDPSEISDDCLATLLIFLKSFSVPHVIFETHCDTVTSEKLAQIRTALPERKVTIEMGYESCDPYVLHTCLRKALDLDQLRRAISRIHEMDMNVCLNVFLGAPFLCPSDQLESARQSILWAVEQGADSVVVFPANIKPFTLLYELYQRGLYQPLSHWMLPALFRCIPEEVLGRITLSWYGERKNFYENDAFPLIPPQACDCCENVLFAFYRTFLREPSPTRRSQLVRELWEQPLECDCRDRLTQVLRETKPRLSPTEIERMV